VRSPSVAPCRSYPSGVQWELLRGLDPADVQRVLAGARRRRFGRGEVLFHEGDPGVTLHLVAKGRIAVRVTTPLGEVAMVDLLVPGDVLGELALLSPGGMRRATATALEPTETLAVDQETFSAMRRGDPSVCEFLVQLLAARVHRLTDRLLEALYVPADVRLLRRVLELSEHYGDVIPLTQEDLAGLAGTTRATVNRVLRREEKCGTLALHRGRVTLVDRPSLAHRSR
jgi:CRP/FNR family cyclic AMP-dependent transcriptional regulator